VKLKKNRFSSRQLKGFFVLIHLLAVVYAIFFLHPYYGSNDEFSLAAIASGAYGDNTAYFIYLHSVFAWIMKAFYLVFPSFNWYTILMYSFMFASLTAIGFTWINRSERTGWIGAVLLVFLSLWPLYVEMQYTKTAAVVTAAGYVLLFYTKQGNCEKKQQSSFGKIKNVWIAPAFGVIFLLLGSFIRFHAFGMVSIMAFGIWLSKGFYAWKSQDWKKFLLRDCVPCMAAFTLVFGSIAAENLLVYRPGTKEAHYREYDKARQQLLDYGVPEWDEYQEEYKALGLSRTDCINLKNWLIADYDRYTADTFRSIVAFRKARPFQWEYLTDYLIILAKKPLFLLGVLATLLWLFASVNFKKQKKAFCMIYHYLALLGIYLYFIKIYRVLPIVVTACLLSFVIFVWSETIERLDENFETFLEGKYFAVAGVCSTLLVWTICFRTLVSPVFLPSPQSSESSLAFRNLYDTISQDKKIYYAFDPFTNNGVELGYSIFEKLPNNYLSNIFTLGGWETESPQMVDNLGKYEQRSLMTSLYKSDRAVFISDTLMEHLMLHLQDTYDGIFITYSKVNQIGNFDLFALNYKMSGLKELEDYSATLDRTYVAENNRYDVFEATVDMTPEELEGKSVFLWVESKESGKRRMYQGIWKQQDKNGLYSMLYDTSLAETNQVKFMVPKMSYPLDDRYHVNIVIRDGDKGRKIVTENNLYD